MHAVIRSRRVVAGAAAATVVVLGGVLGGYVATRPAQLVITAHFVSAPGLYVGNHVDILGVPIGKITRITPGERDVAVEMSLPHDTRVPANAQAVLTAANVVSDRFVQLSPPYTSGPQMQSGASIPTSRVVTPVEVDQLYQSLDELGRALGPNSVDPNGSLGDLVGVAAQNLDGNGQRLHDAITGLAKALPAVSKNSQQLGSLLTDLDTLSRALANHDDTVSAFYRDLATATSQLAGERQDIATALSTLQTALGQLGTFVQNNRAALGANIQNLVTVSNALLAHQRQLIETFDVLPLTISNLGAAVESDPDGLRLRVRASLQPGQPALIAQYCGSSSLPHTTRLLPGGGGTTFDLLCVALDAVLQEPPPPGAVSIVDLGIARFLASG
ncbi:MAG TPA: MCE family protein [Candidatus Dormibacteraeota bacterium]|nr:MCE family protein [Candidatus Dormibacteraeota bacterium]